MDKSIILLVKDTTHNLKGNNMNHPRINTKGLDNETIEALRDVLISRYYTNRAAAYEQAKKGNSVSVAMYNGMAYAALKEHDRLQRFLDR